MFNVARLTVIYITRQCVSINQHIKQPSRLFSISAQLRFCNLDPSEKMFLIVQVSVEHDHGARKDHLQTALHQLPSSKSLQLGNGLIPVSLIKLTF